MKKRLTPTKNDLFTLLGLIVLFGAYFATAKFGLSINAVSGFATLVWAPSGIALAAFVLYGPRLWPAVALAAFAVNLSAGAPPPEAALIALGNTLEPLAGAYFLKNYFNFNPLFSRLSDSFGLIFVSITTSFIAATFGGVSLALGGTLMAGTFTETWLTWWLGDALGILIVAPFLLRWLYRPFFTKTRSELVEGTVLFALLSIACVVIFWSNVAALAGVPLVYVLLIPLIWAALRTGPRGMTLAIFLTALIAIAATLTGGESGVLRTWGLQELLILQIFLGALSVIFLLFVSIVEERKEAMLALQSHIGQLQVALEQIRMQDEAKTDFIATLAHELRNPLSPIVSAVELIEAKGPAHAQTPQLLGVINTHVRTMARLLDDLLDISRITRKKFKLQKETVELQAVLRRSEQTVASFMNDRRHTFKLELPAESIWLSADPVRLEQVFANILFNAAKYTPNGGTIAVRASRINGTVRISITDSGIGIEEDMLAKIFEPFVQGESQGSHSSSGLGIGLSLTKRLVELHGGTITAASRGRGHGSEFTIELPSPAKVELPFTRPAPRVAAVPGATPSARPQKILVVDDNESAAKGLGSLLMHTGHTVELAFSGMDALEVIRAFSPEVVLLDIGMPQMNGYEVARAIIEAHEKPPALIALTGYGQEADKQKAREAGFAHHLIKPVGIADVERVLRSLPKTT